VANSPKVSFCQMAVSVPEIMDGSLYLVCRSKVSFDQMAAPVQDIMDGSLYIVDFV
jgi:hypothetical protein